MGRSQEALGSVGDLDRLRHAADAGFARLGHLAGIGADHRDAVAAELRDVAAGGGVIPHQRIHRRRQQDRTVGCEQNRGRKIVGMALRHLRHQVGGGGSHDNEVTIARKADVAGIEFALGVEQIRVAALMRQRAGGERRDEFLRGVGEHAANGKTPIFQSPDKVERLIGGDAAADDQGNAQLLSGNNAMRLIARTFGGLRRRCGEPGAVL